MNGILFLDIKSTGYDPLLNEVISCTIINSDGDVLLDTLVKPKEYIEFGAVPFFHELDPETVDIKGIEYLELINQIKNIVKDYDTVIGYNLDFDLSFFPEVLFSKLEQIDLMHLTFGFIQEKSEFANLSNFIKLNGAASLFGINFFDLNLMKSHGDCELARRVWEHICSDSEAYKNILQKYKDQRQKTQA